MRVLRLVKIFFSVGFFAAFVWWGMTVRLGERTLFGHVYAIGQTKESKDLVRGTKEKVQGVSRIFASSPQSPPDTAKGQAKVPTAPPQEQITSADRQEIRRMIESARSPVPR